MPDHEKDLTPDPVADDLDDIELESLDGEEALDDVVEELEAGVDADAMFFDEAPGEEDDDLCDHNCAECVTCDEEEDLADDFDEVEDADED